MATKIHTYTCNKGYADQYKTREVKWEVYTTPEEAIAKGAFPDMDTIMQYANAQLNIKKGHAVQEATKEEVKDADGKPTGKLARPNMTAADMEKIARDTVATKSDRSPKGTGGQKAKAKAFDSVQEKARKMAETATPEKLAILLEAGVIDQATHDARLAAIKAATPSKRAGAPAAK